MLSQFEVEFDGRKYVSFYITDRDKAREAISKIIAKPGPLACDLETMALPAYRHIPQAALSPFLSCPRLLQVFTGTGAVVFDLLKIGPLDLSQLFLARSGIFHNLSFDFKFLKEHHAVTEGDFHCTMIMARCVWHAIYPDNRKADLASVTQALFGGHKINKKAGVTDWSAPELTFEQVRYSAQDVVVLHEIHKKLSTYIDQLGLRKVYDLYRKAQLVLCEMELNGLTLDKQTHRKNTVRWREELQEAKTEVLRLTGLPEITDTRLAAWLVSVLPVPVRDLWPRTESGNRLATDADTLLTFSHLSVVAPFSRFKKLQKLTTAFGMNLFTHVSPATGKLHPHYNVAGAKTGRLSCNQPNIQQMPRDKEVRSIFIPSPGYVLVVADYSQIEVRYIAELAQDDRMLTAFEEGLDIYAYTVAGIQKKPIEEVTKEERQAGKALVLGLAYGLGAAKLGHYAKKNYGVEMSDGEASEMVKEYRKLYPQLRGWQLKQVESCPLHRYTAYDVMGKSRKMTEDDFYGPCLNHPVQAGCASIMLLALVKANRSFKGLPVRLLMSVHDEIVLECLPEYVSAVKGNLIAAMRDAYEELVPNPRTMRGLVSPTHGVNWSAAK